MEKYQIEGKIAELQDCVVMCDENLDSTEEGSFTEAVLKDCKSAYIKHIADLEAILNLLPIQNVVGSALKDDERVHYEALQDCCKRILKVVDIGKVPQRGIMGLRLLLPK
jgi:hypothetical protein